MKHQISKILKIGNDIEFRKTGGMSRLKCFKEEKCPNKICENENISFSHFRK